MAKTATTAKPKKATATAPKQTQINIRPSGKNFTASQKYQYHKQEANKAFKSGDIVKSSNHLSAMRRAENTLREQAKWARENKPRK